jgi:hypothetical protein
LRRIDRVTDTSSILPEEINVLLFYLELPKLLMAIKIDVFTVITRSQTQTAFDTMIANKTI